VRSLLADLGVRTPVLAAPMAGGPGTPELVVAAAGAGSMGFLAAGYRTAEALGEQIDIVRAAGVPFGVNLFAPNPVPVDPAAYRFYAQAIRTEFDRYDLEPTRAPLEDDDHWRAKVDLLVADPVPVVSFTFGLPAPGVLTSLQGAGTIVVQTVTSADEARLAEDIGVDALAVQGSAAGGHSGTLTPQQLPLRTPLPELVAQVRAAVRLPLLAAGGVGTAADVVAVRQAGAEAALVGTVLLLTDESGASAPHRAALTDPTRAGTVVTRAFTGRPARALRNEFTDRYDELAPPGYPAVHHLTSPLRRAATAAGDPERINLWAGTGYRQARTGPAAGVIEALAAEL
jgi:nitronate monooxygenase